jgi:hypothetical protein
MRTRASNSLLFSEPTAAAENDGCLIEFLATDTFVRSKGIRLMLMLGFLCITASSSQGATPNILWFVVDDMSPHFSCYGRVSCRHLSLIDWPRKAPSSLGPMSQRRCAPLVGPH